MHLALIRFPDVELAARQLVVLQQILDLELLALQISVEEHEACFLDLTLCAVDEHFEFELQEVLGFLATPYLEHLLALMILPVVQ